MQGQQMGCAVHGPARRPGAAAVGQVAAIVAACACVVAGAFVAGVAVAGAPAGLPAAGQPDGGGSLTGSPAGSMAGSMPGSMTGSMTGSVTLGEQINEHRMKFRLYPDPSSPPPRQISLAEEMRNVVVYLEPAGAPGPAAPAPAQAGPQRMEQIDESFQPHVLPIVKGTSVEFPNADAIYHNVFSLSQAAAFDLGRYPRGDSRSVRFDRAGLVKVYCHIHADMSAVIMVLENRCFATPGSNGRFEIRDIPAGDYVATAWHERAHPVHRRVGIRPGRPTVIDFTIPLQESVVDDEPATAPVAR